MVKKLLVAMMMLVMLPTVGYAGQIHTVQRDDTFWKISKWYQVSLVELIKANPKIKTPEMIYPGQKIIIPQSKVIDRTNSTDLDLMELTNQERAKHGLQPLIADRELDQLASKKSEDMQKRNEIKHESPEYGTLDDMMKGYGIQYVKAAQNIAAGQRTPEEVIRDAMDNPTQRANILNEQYTHIGIGHAKGGPYGQYWTIIFMKK